MLIIWTFDTKGELLITIMSSLAQEESRSISENVRWGQRKKFSDGRYSLNYPHFLGYGKGPKGKLVINQEQAQLVRRIYGLFLRGHSPYQIAKTLTDEGIPTPAGKKKWSYTTIRRVLSNETYMGDKLLQKTYSIDFLSKDRQKNHGEVPQYYVEGDHECCPYVNKMHPLKRPVNTEFLGFRAMHTPCSDTLNKSVLKPFLACFPGKGCIYFCMQKHYESNSAKLFMDCLLSN